jgi:hypothetical protein
MHMVLGAPTNHNVCPRPGYVSSILTIVASLRHRTPARLQMSFPGSITALRVQRSYEVVFLWFITVQTEHYSLKFVGIIFGFISRSPS